VPRAIISDQGSHFYSKLLASLLQKYGVVHRVATTYHPQTNGPAGGSAAQREGLVLERGEAT